MLFLYESKVQNPWSGSCSFCNLHSNTMAGYFCKTRISWCLPGQYSLLSKAQRPRGLCYCVMSSHVHMLIARHGKQNLEGVIRDIKKYTSSKIIETIQNNPQESRRELLIWLFARAGSRNPNNKHYQFWQQHSQPIEINTNEKLDLC